MKIELKRYDYIFIGTIIACSVLHFVCMYTPVPYNDEFLYPVGPLRFINGDNMIQHEWHLSQFSSLFSYFPVLVWLKIKGSTEGIILFLRYVYFIVHVLTTISIYNVFRKYKMWSIVAAVLFYTQVAYRMFTVGYMSLITAFWLLFTIALLIISEKHSAKFYIFAGICFAACCVLNPLNCTLYIVYILFSVIWNKTIQHKKYKSINLSNKQKKRTAHKEKGYHTEVYNTFFSKKAIALFSGGIGILAAISIFYFFITGGTLESLVKDIGNLFVATEYGVFSLFVNKLKASVLWFNDISLGLPFLLPALYIVLLFDVDRNKHRITYLVLSVAIMLVYVCGIAKVFLSGSENAFALSLPFIIFSSVCYVLTENKNRALFYCMWCPSAIGAMVQFFASNTLLTSFFAILVVFHIPGTLFVRDLFMEIRNTEKRKVKHNRNKKNNTGTLCYIIICTAFCIQFVFNCYLYAYNRIPNHEEYTKVTNGPLADFYLDDDYYNGYVNSLNDLDFIKSCSNEDDPVLITSRLGWMHLYIDRPLAAYTPCLLEIDTDLLGLYYQRNPDKIPKYVYVGYVDTYYIPDRDSALDKATVLEGLFDCTTEELTMGFLLTVNGLL